MTTIHDQYQTVQYATLAQVGGQSHLPVSAHGLRYLGIAVAGQVDQIALVAEAEKIDELGAAWLLADVSEPVVIGQGVERARFSGIGAPCECHLYAIGWRQVAQVVRRAMEDGILEQRHAGFDYDFRGENANTISQFPIK